MPEMTIRLRINPETGKKDILIALSEDQDTLPHEHEQMHRQLVDKLINGGLLKAEEMGKIVVEREEKSPQSEISPTDTPMQEKQAHKQGF